MNECFEQKGMHFVHLNIRSIIPKISELRLFALKAKPAVIAISESWLDDSVQNAEVNIDGYVLHRKDRSRTGGGTCVYIMNRYAHSMLDINPIEDNESIWFNIFLPKNQTNTNWSLLQASNTVCLH